MSPLLSTSTDLHTMRARNREAQRRDEVITNVMARLEVYAAMSSGEAGTVPTTTLLRDHATRLVEAVLALAKERLS